MNGSPRWLPIESDFESAREHFSNAVRIFERGGFHAAGLDGFATRMAFLHSMQIGHTGLETGLLRILSLIGEEHPRDDTAWPEDLLRQVSVPMDGRPAILPAHVAEYAQETRRFRSIAVRTYIRFDPARARDAVGAAQALAQNVLPCLHQFRARIDPPDSPEG